MRRLLPDPVAGAFAGFVLGFLACFNLAYLGVEVAGWPVNLISYKLGDAYHAKADNVSPGANLARTSAASREEAERLALAHAGELLSRTRRQAV